MKAHKSTQICDFGHMDGLCLSNRNKSLDCSKSSNIYVLYMFLIVGKF